jgi:UDP-N-acetylglucosamine 2-epimerase (non-hydrolysing)
VAIIYGTRPEIIKLAGLAGRLGERALLIHTGQHFDSSMSHDIAVQAGLPEPELQLAVGGLSRAAQIATALGVLDQALGRQPVDAVVVQGDTNTAVAGALAANALRIPLVHVEAGLRSYDRAMPEEHNRVVIDHLADLLCAPTSGSVDNLAREGITGDRVALTGNTVVEAVRQSLPAETHRQKVLREFGLAADQYVLATIHRPENTDAAGTLARILEQLATLPLRVVLPLHPRTETAVGRFGLRRSLAGMRVLPPVDPRTFLSLAAHAAVLVSDSGGIQEECTVIGRPLIVVRGSTERPEALRDFARLTPAGHGLAAAVSDVLLQGPGLLKHLAALPSPFGDEFAADHILHAMAGKALL